ncbi:hybrid sensor histidine kinase/response regulator transcription factor, partial [Mariniflexile fucanivorans]
SYKYKINDSTSLSSNLVFCSYLDKSNQLWVGTEDGLNLYNRDLDQFKKVSLGLNKSNVSVLSLNGDNAGNLYVGTRQLGLFKINLKTLHVLRISSTEVNPISINSIQLIAKDKVFLGTSVGLRVIDTIKNVIVYPKTALNKRDIESPIQSMLVDNDNNLWVGTMSAGVYKYGFDNESQLEENIHFPISNKRILNGAELSDGTILFGSENDGLFHLNKNGSIIKNYVYNKTDENSIRSNSIWSLFIDKNKRIWMGYYNSGVAVSDKLYDKFGNIESLTSNPNSLKVGSVTSIVKDKSDKVWIGMDGGGIDLYDAKTSKMDHISKNANNIYSGLTSDYIQSVFIDSKGNVWAGSWDNGVYLLKKGAKKFINMNNQNTNGNLWSNAILSFAEDKEGIIWIGTFYRGLHSFNPKTNKITYHDSQLFAKYQITTSDVRKILCDKDGTIWLGTTEGLFQIKKRNNGEFSIISYANRMGEAYGYNRSANHILSLFESSNNIIWIGTRGAGLCRYDKKRDEFKWYNKFSGFNEENVASIIESLDGNIWISGNSGISRLDVNTNEVVNYTYNDGLLSNDFNFNAVLREIDGALYFGNYRGIDFFNPDNINVNTSQPSLYLTGLKIFNKDVVPNKKDSPLNKVISETNHITFNHKQSVFTIEYIGINYTRPEKNQYAYYLEGLEESWNFVGNLRSATYTNLDYGDYTFKLKAANNDGVWNKEPLNIKITILPPWWKTNLAKTTYILLFFLSVYLLNRVIRSRMKEKEAMRNERNQREQEEMLHEKKIQFFTNISHEFRTPLTLMITPLQDILRDTSLNLAYSAKEKLEVVYKNTDRLYRLINELMDFRKLELNKMSIRAKEFNLVSFTKGIVSYFKEEAYNRNISMSVDADIPDLLIWADEGMLEKIIFNLLSNSVKVTPDGGAINIDILSTDNLVELPLLEANKLSKVLEIRVSDTGPGLEKSQVERIFERFYQVENLSKTYYGGTGIGLEVVQNFVHLHKGKIEVESNVGTGSVFRVLLPVGKDHFKKEELVDNPIKEDSQKEKFVLNNVINVSDEEETGAKPNTLLIVEDSSELRNYLKREFKSQYKVFTASNGKEGLKLAKDIIPDVILTDVIMPEMNGFEFCKEIKTDLKTSHIPLLMLTSKTTVDDRMQGIGFGADAYMVKPFDMRLLKLRLNQLIISRKLIFDKYFAELSGKDNITTAASLDKEFIQKVLDYISENISDSDLNVELLASQVDLSRSRLYRKIKAITGQTVTEFLRKIRLQKAKQILEAGNSNISEVCYEVGFSSPSYFTKCFKAHFGILPTDVEVEKEP